MVHEFINSKKYHDRHSNIDNSMMAIKQENSYPDCKTKNFHLKGPLHLLILLFAIPLIILLFALIFLLHPLYYLIPYIEDVIYKNH